MCPSSSSGGLKRGPHPLQRLSWLALQLAWADPQHCVTEARQEGRPLLLARLRVCLRLELHDERALGAHVRDHERADLAARSEVMGME